MVQPWQTGKVIRIMHETPTTRRFWIEVEGHPVFDFKPGQFVTLDLPIHEKPNKRWRSYSIASWPDGTNVFELVIVLLEGGLGTTYLFNEVEVGTELTFRGAIGVFSLPEHIDDKELFLICTGTGIAPFRSMVNHIARNNIARRNVHLIFGCRTKQDLLYYEELTKLTAENENIHYHPVLSREEWHGATGYVHQIYKEICSNGSYKDADGNLHVLPARFYLCGWKNMIDEAKKTIVELGYDKKAIHQEIYG